jgi:N-glycosylase/DNA lyase
MSLLIRSPWVRLVPTTHLRLESSLLNGQSFQWRRSPEGVYTGVLGHQVLSLREHNGSVEYAVHVPATGGGGAVSSTAGPPAAAPKRGGKRRRGESESVVSAPLASAAAAAAAPPPPPSAQLPIKAQLEDYFNLSAPMDALVASWCAVDARMSAICGAVPGVRILRQPPFETLMSFICSSNNNISRIGQMLDKLRATYGVPLGSVAEEGGAGGAAGSAAAGSAAAGAASPPSPTPYHAFPTVEALAGASESDLRALGVGYRAAFIRGTAQAVLGQGGEAYLLSLRGSPRATVQGALCQYPGVGRKVADCVALFSLDQPDIVPVDTHVWTIAVRDMDPTLGASQSLTPTVYDRVGDLFRARYVGGYAGWAHSLLFTAELPAFKAALPLALQAEMEAFTKAEKATKALKKEAAKGRKLAKETSKGGKGGAEEGGVE